MKLTKLIHEVWQKLPDRTYLVEMIGVGLFFSILLSLIISAIVGIVLLVLNYPKIVILSILGLFLVIFILYLIGVLVNYCFRKIYD